MARASLDDGYVYTPETPTKNTEGEKGKTAAQNAAADAAAKTAAKPVATKPLNKMTSDELAAYQADRLAQITKNRETGNGTNPPSEAPAGMHWSFIGGQWKLYTDQVGGAASAGSGATGGAAGGASASTAAANLVAQQNQTAIDEANKQNRQSAYDTLMNEFSKYGLGSLVEGVKGLIQQNVSPSQFAIALQNTKEYQQRFAANQDRIKAGLRALSPAEYIGLEDQYQNIMRTYGLPASYYSKDSMGKQAGFEKFLANDVSASELEDRIATAQQRVLNSNPEVLTALKQFYPDINNADILAYTLDPQNALTNIKRKVTAAEIGGAALAQGLQAQGGTAESLAGQGITKAQAQQGYQNIAQMVPRGSQLADIYGQTPYTQRTAEAEVFGTTGAADAAAKRKKLVELETASFSGQSGVGALGRDKNLYGQAFGQQGQY
jgi:hypothetical protein